VLDEEKQKSSLQEFGFYPVDAGMRRGFVNNEKYLFRIPAMSSIFPGRTGRLLNKSEPINTSFGQTQRKDSIK